jgi:hypothetical protein
LRVWAQAAIFGTETQQWTAPRALEVKLPVQYDNNVNKFYFKVYKDVYNWGTHIINTLEYDLTDVDIILKATDEEGNTIFEKMAEVATPTSGIANRCSLTIFSEDIANASYNILVEMELKPQNTNESYAVLRLSFDMSNGR